MIPRTDCQAVDACCVTLYDIANHLLAEVFDAVTQCYPTDCCETLAAYVTMGSGDDGITDALTVGVTSVQSSAHTLPGGLGLWRAEFAVILRESGWPTAYSDGDTIVLPSPTEQARASQHVFAMGESIHRRLAFLMGQRALVPRGTRCSNGTVGTMNPLYPQGGVVGWQVPVIIDLPWN